MFTVDAIFIRAALTTNSGVVTEQAYEKGLNYNNTLQEAKDQPVVQDKVSFENNILRWVLLNEKV